MNQPDINTFAYLVNSVAMLLMLLIFMGVTFRVSQMLMAVFAYPIYLALFYFELMSGKNTGKRKFFALNIPEENPKRFWMNFSAFMVALLIIPNFLKIYMALNLSPEAQSKVMLNIVLGSSNFQMWGNIVLLSFIVIIYLISYFTEIDERDPMTKIEELSIPSLWKGVLKKI
ncbi:hypothetical protein [Pseudoalteromonas phenolica]|uniref:hypothetical protein n=1 Tax=Pseudoalteromonas phenolica TaxID=161398 RepID=UPI00110AB377|nr:hypothetical protein [Pseudoalteromonas phenolica]TMO52855.1 hypothetical protein CWC21_21580 [Pseudoalteromonas phenolica]